MTENAQQRAERRYRLLHTALKEMAEFEREGKRVSQERP